MSGHCGLRFHVALVSLNARWSHTGLACRALLSWGRMQRRAERWVHHEFHINDRLLPQLTTLEQSDADLYAFSCYLWNMDRVRELSRALKALRPERRIVWGGPEAASQAEHWMACEPSVDAIVCGEGEQAFASLAGTNGAGDGDAVSSGADVRGAGDSHIDWSDARLAAIPGLVWRSAGGAVVTNPPGVPLDPEVWPFPYTDDDLAQNRGRILYYESSRGCPFACAYCLSALDRTVRLRSLANVYADLERFFAAGVRLIKFVDRTFNCQPKRALAIWRYLADAYASRPDLPSCHFEIIGDLLDDEAIDLLNQMPPGKIQLEIGVQTTDPDVLRLINRPCDLGRLENAVRRLSAGGRVHLHLDLIAGLPAETPAGFDTAVDRVLAMQPQALQLGFLKVLPASPIEAIAAARGFVWLPQPPYEILRSDGLSFTDLARLRDRAAMIDRFWNSGHFRRSISALLLEAKSPSSRLDALAAYCRANGWFDRSLKFADQVRLYAEFAQTLGLGDGWLDLLREDYRSSGQRDRPPWLFSD